MTKFNERIFRGLDDEFFKELKEGMLSCILDYQRKYRKSFLVEIRDDFLDLYFLGHGILVRRTSDNRYYLSASKAFNPKDILEGINIKESEKSGVWKIFFDEIEGHFEDIMNAIIAKIIMHRHGDISEGVSEMNHFIDNREKTTRNGILIIDRQVSYPGMGGRMDLLGLKRMQSGDFTFAIVELKNRNNSEIAEVYSQVSRYIDDLYEEDTYERFAETYRYVMDQKIELGLLRKISGDIVPFGEITKKDIEGIVILDDYDIKAELKPKSLLMRALKNWSEVGSEYNLKLFIKTNVLDSTFFLNRKEAAALLVRYKKSN